MNMDLHHMPNPTSSRPFRERTRSIFDTMTRELKIEAAQDSVMSVSSDKPVGHEVRVSKKHTYQLGPRNTFKSSEARGLAEKVVGKWITKETVYSVEWSRIAAKAIAGGVEKLLKRFNLDRYKFVVQVVIAQNKRQGAECCSRVLSDTRTDGFCEFTFQNDTLWCVVLVFAMYHE